MKRDHFPTLKLFCSIYAFCFFLLFAVVYNVLLYFVFMMLMLLLDPSVMRKRWGNNIINEFATFASEFLTLTSIFYKQS